MSLSLQDTTSEGTNKLRTRRRSRRTRTKDLENEVELIMSQEDDSDVEMEKSKENHVHVTPKTLKAIDPQNRTPNIKSDMLAHTPRRSTRKSIKPVQEYEDIVGRKRQLRSTSKVDAENTLEADVEPQAKWTPAKVGRVSQKRGRKSRRNTQGDKNKSKLISSSENEDSEPQTKSDSKLKEIVALEAESNIERTEKIETKMQCEDSVKSSVSIDLNVKIIENEDIIAEGNSEITLKTMNELGEVKEATQLKEKNINKHESGTPHKNTENVIEETNKEEFGTYLKNNTLEMLDLGLNPLIDDGEGDMKSTCEERKAEDENKFNKKAKTTNMTEIQITVETIQDNSQDKIVDGRPTSSFGKTTDERALDDVEIPVVTINDDTFNSSDCMLVDINAAERVEEMQPLRLSDDESCSSPPKKTPRIILTTENGEQKILDTSIPSNEDVTQKRYSKVAQRMPTPYKPKTAVCHKGAEIDQEDNTTEEHSIEITVSTMEPKDFVLRSIRKRSWSVCIGGAEAENRRKNVTFYSPANQTTILEELDMRIVQSVKKPSSAKSSGDEAFVTQRRKRSLSFDEALINKSKSRVGVTPQKPKPTRTKLPNFAAIHQKHFEKMENVVDHVNRKAERAKILSNSATKPRSASAKKPVKIEQATNMATAGDRKPKAVKRINLPFAANSTFSGTTNSSLHRAADALNKCHNDSKLPIPRIAVCKPILTTETIHKENREVNLPNPRLGIIKPHTITIASSKNKQSTPAKNVLKATQIRQVTRPAFNLSTAVESHATGTKSTNAAGVPTTNATVTKTHAKSTTTAAATAQSIDEKMAKRRQRHMDMFKGRGANVRTTPGSAEKTYTHIIRGVRSNRRFELQMAHRMNTEH